jgi:putative membrane protein
MNTRILGALALGLSLSFAAHSQSKAPAKAPASKDAGVLKELADADLAEVAAGKLAAGKASSADVKKFAEHMQMDHGENLAEAKKLADQKGVELPSQPAQKHQATMKKLESASGAAFDKTYMDEMVKGHREVLAKLKAAGKSAKDPEIKAIAEKTAPKVEEHLKMAQQIAQGLGKASSGSSSAGSK